MVTVCCLCTVTSSVFNEVKHIETRCATATDSSSVLQIIVLVSYLTCLVNMNAAAVAVWPTVLMKLLSLQLCCFCHDTAAYGHVRTAIITITILNTGRASSYS